MSEGFLSLEALGVSLALAYLLLAIRQNTWCWPAALLSASIYLVLLAETGLYVQSALQLFYIATAFYGWWHWQQGKKSDILPVKSWAPREHVWPCLAILAAGSLSGFLLSNYTEAVSPWLDAFTGWGSIIATWMVARKILQTWLYWLLIDSVLVYVYLSQELWLTAGLFVIYLVLAMVAYFQWQRSMQHNLAGSHA